MMLRIVSVPAVLAAVGGACSAAPAAGGTVPDSIDAQVVSPAEIITAEDMYARIYFLSSDALAGRDTWSQGLEAAAAYLVSEHRRLGLEPGGEDETFYQRYPFRPRGAMVAPLSSATGVTYPPNVAAILPGSDPELRHEFVILSAHFDHVGIGMPVDGDSIYNGADDNGSGTAALLEVAEAFAELPERPRRSIMFLHVSGEEHGLLGSRWFSENPTVPTDQIIANVNVDMIGRNAPDSIVVIGKEYSTLGEVVESAGGAHPELGLTVSDDVWPEERFFFRSDHFNFTRLEIPALFFFSGVHEDYHQPSDTVDKVDTDKVARVAQLIYYTVRDIANADGGPRWDPEGLEQVRMMSR